jgi:Spy/CpxP family protein refolding chaperone
VNSEEWDGSYEAAEKALAAASQALTPEQRLRWLDDTLESLRELIRARKADGQSTGPPAANRPTR